MARLTGQDLLRRGRRRIVGYVPFSNEREGDRALLRRAMQLTVPIIGNCDELESVLRRTAVAEVYIAGNARKHEDEMQRAIQICERMGIPFAIPAYTFRLERAWPIPGSTTKTLYLAIGTLGKKPGGAPDELLNLPLWTSTPSEPFIGTGGSSRRG